MSRNKVEPATTPWFPTIVCPVRVGVYQVQVPRFRMYSYWSGNAWYWLSRTTDSAALENFPSEKMKNPMSKWRGLAQEPKQ